MGIKARNVGFMDDSHVQGSDAQLGVPVVVRFQTTASASTYSWENDGTPGALLVTKVYGYMTGAGDTSDTVVVQQISGGTTTAITTTVDVSSLGDRDEIDFAEINDAAQTINSGDTLRVTTASAALADVYVEGFWIEA